MTGDLPHGLTPLQQSMVRALLRAPRSGVYIIQDVCEFAGSVDIRHLQQAWRIVAHAHPALRTRIVRIGAAAHSTVVEEQPQLEWREIHTTDVDAFLQEDWQRGFDFDQGVPMRFALLRHSEQSSTLIWTVHHALVDGRSLLIVWRAWMEAYDCLCRVEPATAAPEYVAPAAPVAQDAAEQYWRSTLAGTTQTTGFLLDRAWQPPDPLQPVYQKETITLSAQRTDEITRFARHHEVTLNTVVLGTWALLLSRYSGRDDVVFGVTRTGRQRPQAGADNRVGVFIHTLPFRVTVPADALPDPWLRQLRAQWVLQGGYGNTPLDKVAEWGELPAGQPPFDTVLVYDHEPPGETLRQLGGTWHSRSFRRLQRTDAPLTLVAYGRPAIRLEIVFDTRRFSRHAAAAMVRHLHNILDGLAGPSEVPLVGLPMVTGAEERWLLDEGNPVRTPRPPELCAHQLFEEQARLRPRKTALETLDSAISYQELDQRANAVAWQLRERGAGVEDLVAVCLPRSPQAVLAVLGVLKSGAAFLTLDPNLPLERLEEMVAGAGARMLIADRSLAREWRGAPPVTLLDDLAVGPTDAPPNMAAAGNAAYAIFTSGSTGKPKAILVTHASLVNYVLAVRGIYGLSDADRRLQFASPGADVFVAEVFNYLSCGATLVFGPERRESSIQEFVRLLDERRITITGLPSTWWREWVEAARGGLAVPRSLRAVIAGMERVDAGALVEWRRLTGTTLRWFNAYGPAETTCTSMIYEAGTSEWEGASFVPVGKPVANTCGYILDGAGRLLPAGVAGELYIGGDGVARGYLNAPERTAARFLPDPFRTEPGSRMYRTGDLVFRLPDGNIVFLGRTDRQVKIRGHRIELEELESVLAQHAGIRHCAVVVDGAEGREKLVAYFTPCGEPPPGRDALRLHMARRLPAYMVPSAFVALAEMPRGAGGKIDRQSLPPLGGNPPQVGDGQPEAADGTEELLAGLWGEALGVADVAPSADFFELGGDSLSAARLLTGIHHALGHELSLSDLLEAPSPAAMAKRLLLGKPEAGPANGRRPPLFCTAAAIGLAPFRNLAAQLGPEQPLVIIPHQDALAKGPGDGNAERLRQVPAMAEELCRAVQALRPQGPYLLGGYCLGGVVAFEAARRLLASGADVRMVVLFDTPAPGYPKLLAGRTRYGERLRRALLGEAIRWKEILAHLALVGQLLRRKMRTVPALRPAAFDVVHFLAGSDSISTQVLEDPRLGWRDLCQGKFTAHKLAGGHLTLFKEPHVAELAARLSEVLRIVNASDGRAPESGPNLEPLAHREATGSGPVTPRLGITGSPSA